MWGGGMMFNEIALQEDALPIVEELGILFKPAGDGHYTVDSVATTATIISRCVEAGTKIFNLIKVTDVLFREVDGRPRIDRPMAACHMSRMEHFPT